MCFGSESHPISMMSCWMPTCSHHGYVDFMGWQRMCGVHFQTVKVATNHNMMQLRLWHRLRLLPCLSTSSAARVNNTSIGVGVCVCDCASTKRKAQKITKHINLAQESFARCQYVFLLGSLGYGSGRWCWWRRILNVQHHNCLYLPFSSCLPVLVFIIQLAVVTSN